MKNRILVSFVSFFMILASSMGLGAEAKAPRIDQRIAAIQRARFELYVMNYSAWNLQGLKAYGIEGFPSMVDVKKRLGGYLGNDSPTIDRITRFIAELERRLESLGRYQQNCKFTLIAC